MAWFHTPLGQAVLREADAAAEAARPAPAADDDVWYSPHSPVSAAGTRVTAETAMQTSAVFSCVRVIAETVGSLPLITYRYLERGKERATDHPLFNLLRHSPNRRQTALEFFEMMTGHCALRGNAYAEPVYGRGGYPTELWPLHPDGMRVNLLDNGRVGYLYTDLRTGVAYRYNEDEIFHLRGLSSDGVLGLSPIGYARNSIGLALAAEDYGSRFFRNDATPRLLLKHPNHFANKESREEFKKAWQAAQAGANRFRTAVLEDGMDVKELGITNADAEFLATRKYQVADIARVFRVPLVLIGETEKSTSWGTGIEQFMQAFVTHTMRPWLVRWEQAIFKDFLAEEDGTSEHFVEFLVDALLRGDTKTRYDAYASAISAKWMVPNEAREKENMNPIEGGDEVVTMPGSAASPKPSRRPDDRDDAETVEEADALVAREVAFLRKAPSEDSISRFYGAYRRELQLLLGRARGEAIGTLRERDVRAVFGSHKGLSLVDSWEVGGGLLLRHYAAEETK